MILPVNYHYVRRDYTQPHPGIFGITPSQFEKQLDELSKYGSFISQQEIKERIERGTALENDRIEYLITFDDGLKEQFDEALPILKQKGIPAVFYVNTVNFRDRRFSLVHQIHLLRSRISAAQFLELLSGHAESRVTLEERQKAISHYRYDEEETAVLKYILNFKLSFAEQSSFVEARFPEYFGDISSLHASFYMSRGQLIELAELGYLGSHAHEHLPLGLYPEAEIKRQLSESKDFLENLTQTVVYGVSYPYGSLEACGGKVPLIAEECGYSYGLSTERAGNFDLENPLLMARFNCNDVPGGKSNQFSVLTPEKVEDRSWRY